MKKVIHAVGPIYHNGLHGEEEQLRSAIKISLEKAEEFKLESISFPAISSGIFGYPKEKCATDFFRVITAYCKKESDSKVKHIRLTNFDSPTVSVFCQIFELWKSWIENEEQKIDQPGFPDFELPKPLQRSQSQEETKEKEYPVVELRQVQSTFPEEIKMEEEVKEQKKTQESEITQKIEAAVEAEAAPEAPEESQNDKEQEDKDT